MTNDRYFQLMNDLNERLTQQEIEEGWHFCPDWDGLLIHESHPEFECCTCNGKDPKYD